MHLYLFVRGKFEQVELWKAHSQCAYWKWRRISLKTGKEEIKIIQGALRPTIWGAYEYIFPEEALTEVLSFFGITEQMAGDFRYKFMRPFFNCKKIPKKNLREMKDIPDCFLTEEFERASQNCIIPGVAVQPIGIKEDRRLEWKEAGYIQEML